MSESSLAGARASLQIKPQNQKEEGCEAIREQSETSQRNYKVQGGCRQPLNGYECGGHEDVTKEMCGDLKMRSEW